MEVRIKMEGSEKKINFKEGELPQPPRKPNWLVCFFKALANVYFSGFIGKDLITGKKVSNRFLYCVMDIFFLIMQSLPVALFVSYFLITLPTWILVLVIVRMALDLFILVRITNRAKKCLAKRQEPIKYSEEKQQKEEGATNHVKVYEYGNGYYKNKPTTLIGDFFRYIGTRYFAFLFGKDFMYGKKIERSQSAKNNIINIISMLCFLALVIPCFFITLPKWLFVLAIVTAVAKLASIFCNSYATRQNTMKDLFFCKCQGENQVHVLSKQVRKNDRADVADVPDLKFIDKNAVADHH